MNSMMSYHGDAAVKEKYLGRVREHQEADRLVQGYGYWQDGKGCAVGCTLEQDSGAHGQYPIQLGLPEWLARLEDHLFEAMPKEAAQTWPADFLTAIPVGVPEREFDLVRDQFQIYWLERQKTQIDQAAHPQVVAAIDGVLLLLNAALTGAEPESEAWAAAWSAAGSAAWSAARSAAEAAARSEALVKRDWLLAALKSMKPAA